MWFPKLKPGGMLAGDDFADAHDAYFAKRYHAKYHWGVKSAVSEFSRTVGSPFFLTFADRSHSTTENSQLNSTAEWDERDENQPKWATVRRNAFYSAWYLFK